MFSSSRLSENHIRVVPLVVRNQSSSGTKRHMKNHGNQQQNKSILVLVPKLCWSPCFMTYTTVQLWKKHVHQKFGILFISFYHLSHTPFTPNIFRCSNQSLNMTQEKSRHKITVYSRKDFTSRKKRMLEKTASFLGKFSTNSKKNKSFQTPPRPWKTQKKIYKHQRLGAWVSKKSSCCLTSVVDSRRREGSLLVAGLPQPVNPTNPALPSDKRPCPWTSQQTKDDIEGEKIQKIYISPSDSWHKNI